MRFLDNHLKRFWRDATGAVAFETVIVFPILVWGWVGTFSYFDAYRVYNSSIKATYTVADLLSRQTDMIDATDIEGMNTILASMIRDADNVNIRVTQVFRNADMEYSVDWSEATGTLAALATPNLPSIQDRLPNMAPGERVVLVESFISYTPEFSMALGEVNFENFTLTRPRYAGQVPFDDGSGPSGATHDDGVI